MVTRNFSIVYTACGTLWAQAIRDELELAGIPAMLVNSMNGTIDIAVPASLICDARNLLVSEPRTGEIFVASFSK